VHFVKEGEFDEISQFRAQIEEMYGIKIQLFGPDFKREVQRLLDEQGIKAIIMGNRRSDPWSQNLKSIDQSSPGWPDFVRVFPILDWSYANVWEFLK
jgi:3'-phosphoadenosine 5'-phosphosulfate sulfotransferase (PAPS reductase)/FAD synthetase